MIDVDRAWVAEAMASPGASRHTSCDICDLSASPRIRVVTAPRGRAVGGDPSIGASVNSPRGAGPVAVLAQTHAVFGASPRREGVDVKAEWESRGTWMALCGRRGRNAASGRQAKNGVARGRHTEIETGDPEEGVLCPWIAIGIDTMHDDVPLTPGSSLGRIPESSRTRAGATPAPRRNGTSDHRVRMYGWLSGGSWAGGCTCLGTFACMDAGA